MVKLQKGVYTKLGVPYSKDICAPFSCHCNSFFLVIVVQNMLPDGVVELAVAKTAIELYWWWIGHCTSRRESIVRTTTNP